MSHLVAPSLLSADFLKLGAEIEMVNKSEADWFHLDIMDGVFVPNISFGFPVVQHISRHAQKLLDVHLMIIDPDRYLEEFKKAGAGYLTVHYEACNHLHRTLHKIKDLGMKAGVALNPHTNVSLLDNIVADADLILIMSVNPGFGGQKFIKNAYSKISRLKEMIIRKNSPALIQVDGGVDLLNAARLIECGTDILVAGNTVFVSQNPTKTISELKNIKPR